MKVPEDRNPCLTLFVAEKKPALKFIKKGEVLKSMHKIAMEAIRSRPNLLIKVIIIGLGPLVVIVSSELLDWESVFSSFDFFIIPV